MHELLGLSFSPWSEKAAWALDVRRVPYRYRAYKPIIGEPALRIKTRRWRGNVTVPVLTDARGHVYDDSAKIARFADAHGEGPRLFPPEQEAKVLHWIEVSERGLSAGRLLSLQRQLLDEQALVELVPPGLKRVLGKHAARLGRLGIERTIAKYDTPGPFFDRSPEGALRPAEQARAIARAALDELRAALVSSTTKPATILGSFSFADIAAAQLLSFVSPPAFGLKLGKATRRGFTDPELESQYADLVAWRDALYDTYRPRRQATKP